MPSITSANLANAIVKLVAADALPSLVGNLVMGNLVNRDYEPTLARAGDTASVPIMPGLPIVLNTHAEATFQIPDITKVLAVPDLLRIYMQPAVVSIEERIERDLLSLRAGFTSNAALGTPGTPITDAVLEEADTALFQAKVPQNRPKYLIVDANTYSQMRKLKGFAEFQTASEAGLRSLIDGSIGKVKGFYVFRSRYAHSTDTLAFERDAIGLAVRRLPPALPGTGVLAEYAELGNFGMRVTMNYQPNTLSQQFTVEVLYGCAALRNNHAVQIHN